MPIVPKKYARKNVERQAGERAAKRTQSVRQYVRATPAWFTMKLSQLRYVIVITVVFCAGSSVKSAPGDAVSGCKTEAWVRRATHRRSGCRRAARR